MADREFDTDAERKAYAAGIEDTAAKVNEKKLTRADIRKMTPAEIADRLPEVRAALKGTPASAPQRTGGGGGDDE